MFKFKNINLHIIGCLIAIGLAVFIHHRFSRSAATFNGIAETKELTISLETSVRVKEIYVTAGQLIQAGELLAELYDSDLPKKINNISHQIEEMRAALRLHTMEVRSEIKRLEAMKSTQNNDIQSQLHQLKAEYDLNKSIVRELRSIDIQQTKPTQNLKDIQIKALEKELDLAANPLKVQINKLKKELKSYNNPLQIQIEKLEMELEMLMSEKSELLIYAETSGVIGSVFYKEGEKIPPFSTILTIDEHTPSVVNGFIHEGLVVSLELGDSIEVSSTLHPEIMAKGLVTGMGSRVVEFPERLRKYPEHKLWGREIQIQIPANNNFLQGEKVVLTVAPQFVENQPDVVRVNNTYSEHRLNKALTKMMED